MFTVSRSFVNKSFLTKTKYLIKDIFYGQFNRDLKELVIHYLRFPPVFSFCFHVVALSVSLVSVGQGPHVHHPVLHPVPEKIKMC